MAPEKHSAYMLATLTVHMQLMHISHSVLAQQVSMIESNLEKHNLKKFKEANDALVELSWKLCQMPKKWHEEDWTVEQVIDYAMDIYGQALEILSQVNKEMEMELEVESLRKWVI